MIKKPLDDFIDVGLKQLNDGEAMPWTDAKGGLEGYLRRSIEDARKRCKKAVEIGGVVYPTNPTTYHLPESGGIKHDDGKARMDLLPMDVLQNVATVLTFGADKYGDHNWRKGLKYSRLFAATMRHLASFQNGTDIDAESGQSHLDHAICNLLMLSHFARTNREELDDRYK